MQFPEKPVAGFPPLRAREGEGGCGLPGMGAGN